MNVVNILKSSSGRSELILVPESSSRHYSHVSLGPRRSIGNVLEKEMSNTIRGRKLIVGHWTQAIINIYEICLHIEDVQITDAQSDGVSH